VEFCVQSEPHLDLRWSRSPATGICNNMSSVLIQHAHPVSAATAAAALKRFLDRRPASSLHLQGSAVGAPLPDETIAQLEGVLDELEYQTSDGHEPSRLHSASRARRRSVSAGTADSGSKAHASEAKRHRPETTEAGNTSDAAASTAAKRRRTGEHEETELGGAAAAGSGEAAEEGAPAGGAGAESAPPKSSKKNKAEKKPKSEKKHGKDKT